MVDREHFENWARYFVAKESIGHKMLKEWALSKQALVQHIDLLPPSGFYKGKIDSISENHFILVNEKRRSVSLTYSGVLEILVEK